LGTAQLGLPYGVANETGQVGRGDTRRILSRARSAGVDTLDTAISYGESEQRLGEIGVAGWRVVSKLPATPEAIVDVSGWVHRSVEGVLDRLGVSRLYGLLLHRPRDLLTERGPELYGAMVAARERGLVRRIGVSVYDPSELETLFDEYEMDLVQVPFNVFDRRFESSGWLGRLRDTGVEVHTRSAFLQGLLLMPSHRRPPRFDIWKDLWHVWEAWLEDRNQSALQACLGYVLAHRNIDRVVVGVDSLAQLEEVLAAVDLGGVATDYPSVFETTDLNLINPARWRAE
jgi:aryl-alcohol dehydrogenase-like predicted oxidoreductase